jgi:glycine cleavage system H protein
MGHPTDRSYSKDHEWVVIDGDVATVGITHFAQDQLGEVVYVDLPSVGDSVTAGDPFGEIESVKSVSELYAPLSGEIIEVNDSLDDSPETVNQDAHGEGWMVKLKLSDAAQIDALIDAAAYDAFLAEA